MMFRAEKCKHQTVNGLKLNVRVNLKKTVTT